MSKTMALEAFRSAMSHAYKMQNAKLLPWKFTTVPDENGWAC